MKAEAATEGTIVIFPTGTLGVDKTDADISAAFAGQLYAAGYRFASRSIELPGQSTAGMLTASEAKGISGAGLAIGLYQIYRSSGVTAAQGQLDGAYIASRAQELGCPTKAGLRLWCDMEGGMGDADADTLIQYLNNWADAVVAAGYVAGLYNGKTWNNEGQPILSGQQISDLAFTAYWQAAGYVTMPLRGYQMYQLLPMAVTLPGTADFDVDVVQQDFYQDVATFWAP